MKKKYTKKLSNPMINFIGESKANDLIATGDKSLQGNWMNKERDAKDPKCILHYGVQDGKVFGYAVQTDFDDYIKVCQELRDLEKENKGKQDTWLGKLMVIIPRIIELEMIAKGYPIDEILQSGDLSDIYKFVEHNCPEFKTTNLFLTARTKAKIIT